MKKHYWVSLLIFLTMPVWAEVNLEPLLNKVILQLQAERWVTTTTALVNVKINASVTDQGIEQVQTNIMTKLNQIADKAEWHVLSFDRQLDKSELENIQIIAQARLQQSELANLRGKAKSLSKPGETFTIESVQFTPSDEEIRQANMALRNAIYQQAKAEIDTLNKTYPQKYDLHTIDFIQRVTPVPMNMLQNMAMPRVAAVSADMGNAIGNKVELQATVVLAAVPELLTQRSNPKIFTP